MTKYLYTGTVLLHLDICLYRLKNRNATQKHTYNLNRRTLSQLKQKKY